METFYNNIVFEENSLFGSFALGYYSPVPLPFTILTLVNNLNTRQLNDLSTFVDQDLKILPNIKNDILKHLGVGELGNFARLVTRFDTGEEVVLHYLAVHGRHRNPTPENKNYFAKSSKRSLETYKFKTIGFDHDI